MYIVEQAKVNKYHAFAMYIIKGTKFFFKNRWADGI